MMLWIRARRPWWMVAALVLLLGVDRLAGGQSLSVPALFGGGASFVFVRTFLPLIWAAANADSFAGRGFSIEVRPPSTASVLVSRLGLYDAVLFVAATSITAVLFSITPPGGLSKLSSVLVLSGVTCIGTLRAGPAMGAFASTMLMLLTSVYPRNAPAARFIHILQPDGDPIWSATCGVVICLAATAMLATNSALTRFRTAEVSAM